MKEALTPRVSLDIFCHKPKDEEKKKLGTINMLGIEPGRIEYEVFKDIIFEHNKHRQKLLLRSSAPAPDPHFIPVCAAALASITKWLTVEFSPERGQYELVVCPTQPTQILPSKFDSSEF